MSEIKFPEYESFDFSEVAAALREIRVQYWAGVPLIWSGPENLHYRIGATNSTPEWHFSEEGLAHHADQGRDFWDVYTQVTFQIGAHNGIMMVEPDLKAARSHADAYRRLLAQAHMD